MENVLIFDSETTGLSYKDNGIIELAFIVEKNGKVVDEALFKMNPVGKEISQGALDVTGYTIEEIEAFPTSKDVYHNVLAFFDKHIDKYDKMMKFIPGGHNIQFDIDFLRQFFKDNGNNFLGSYMHWGRNLDSLHWITPLQWMGKLPTMKNNKLITLCEELGVDLTNSHTALADARATRECLLIMKELSNG